VKGKAQTRVSTGPLLTLGFSSFRDRARVWTSRGLRTYMYRGPVSLCGNLNLLRWVVSPCHVAPFGLPTQWGQALFPAWLGDVTWVRRLHVVEEGTPDLGYRQRVNTIRRCRACCSSFLEYIKISSMKTTTNLSNSGINTEFIRYVKWAGAFVNPKDITKYLNNPYHVVNAVLGISSGRIQIWW
jgi:hypothetical protein